MKAQEIQNKLINNFSHTISTTTTTTTTNNNNNNNVYNNNNNRTSLWKNFNFRQISWYLLQNPSGPTVYC
jgi:hypothetical protein